MKDFKITLHVQVSIPVELAYDEKPTLSRLRKDAIDNFLQHPVIRDPGYRSSLDQYVDSVGNGEYDLGGMQ